MLENCWQATASLKVLQVRADLISIIHIFFQKQGVLQVDTPAISQYANTDPSIESFVVQQQETSNKPQNFYLHTSPEFPMKRLLADGMGSIYQICKVFRALESGRYHNPEFTMLEWYRMDFDHFKLMTEIEMLMASINIKYPFFDSIEKISYQQLFLNYLNINPITSTRDELQQYVEQNAAASIHNLDNFSHNDICDYLMSHIIQEQMPHKSLIFVYDYPAAQASLAQLNIDKKTARRFEVFVSGIELANGFHELRDAQEQHNRFLNDQKVRRESNQTLYPIDGNLIQALHAGLPNCAGVAFGLERLLMLLVGAKHINEVLTFSFERA